MKKLLLYILLCFVFLIVERQLSVLAPIPFNFLCRFLLFFAFIYGWLKWKQPAPRLLLLALLIGYVLPDGIIRTLEDSFRTFPDVVIELAAGVSAYALYRTKRPYAALLSLALLIPGMIWGSKAWLHYAEYGNFSGISRQTPAGDWAVYNEHNDTLTAKDYQDKLVVFDIWNTACGPCFRKFPQLETLYQKYKSNPHVAIQALDLPWQNDTVGHAFRVIADKGYSFPVVVATGNTEASFKIDAIPMVLILHRNEIIFRGDIAEVDQVLANRLAE